MGSVGGAPHQSASDGLMDWRLVPCRCVIQHLRDRARVGEVGVPVKIDGQVGRGSAGGACSGGRRVGEGTGLAVQAGRDAGGWQRVGPEKGGRGQAGDRGCCRKGKGEGGIGVVLGGGQHQVRVVGFAVLPGRLAGNPPFLLGRRGEGELPVQLEERLFDRGLGWMWVRVWTSKSRARTVVVGCWK